MFSRENFEVDFGLKKHNLETNESLHDDVSTTILCDSFYTQGNPEIIAVFGGTRTATRRTVW